MNGCTEWREKLADHALGMAADSALQSHLRQCPSCAAALTLLRDRAGEFDRLTAAVVSVEPPPSLADRVLQQINGAPRPRRRWEPALAFAVLVLVCLLLFYWRSASVPAIPEGPHPISNWRSPTASLLRSSSEPLLKEVPRLGETYYPMNFKGEKNEE